MKKSLKRVLLVDDSPDILLVISQVLSEADYEVFVASSAHEALSILKRIDVSLIVTDEMMPVMKGSELCRTLRAQEKYQLLPIICLTCVDQPELIREIYASGANDYIRKPVLFEELIACAEHQIIAYERALALQQANASLQQEIVEHQRTAEALHNALRQSRQATEVKGRFLSNMSHELRTPLNGILGFTQLAIDQIAEQHIRSDLRLVKDASEAMLRLIEDLLSLAQLETGCLALEERPLNLSQLLGDVEKLFEIQCAAAGKTLVIEVAPDMPEKFVGDALRLRQILMTLVDNAVKFTTSRGAILVYMRPRFEADGVVTLCCAVSDNGVGIEPASIPNLFQPFSQLDSSGTREHGGAGIGLSIARHLIRMMQGDVEVLSIPDVGSSFRFTVRLQCGEPVRIPPVDAARSTLRLRRSQPVLVVEDNEVNQRLLLSILHNRGYPVLTAKNGQEALETLAKHPVSIILMDCQMPVLDGFEATRRIRSLADQSKREVPVVAISASMMGSEYERCLASGMDAVVPKPISQSTLFAVIEQFTKEPVTSTGESKEQSWSGVDSTSNQPLE